MNLKKKKRLASRTLNVGAGRIAFVKSRTEEIKDAITKQDIKELHKEGAIIVKEVKGRKKNPVKKKKKRGPGKVKKRVNTRKKDYVTITRKLRKYIQNLKVMGRISQEDFKDIRKKIRNRKFPSLSSLKTYIGGLNKFK